MAFNKEKIDFDLLDDLMVAIQKSKSASISGTAMSVYKVVNPIKQENEKLRECLELIRQQGGTDIIVDSKISNIIDVTLKELEGEK